MTKNNKKVVILSVDQDRNALPPTQPKYVLTNPEEDSFHCESVDHNAGCYGTAKVLLAPKQSKGGLVPAKAWKHLKSIASKKASCNNDDGASPEVEQAKPIHQDYVTSIGLSHCTKNQCTKPGEMHVIKAAQLVGDYQVHVQLLEELVNIRDECWDLRMQVTSRSQKFSFSPFSNNIMAAKGKRSNPEEASSLSKATNCTYVNTTQVKAPECTDAILHTLQQEINIGQMVCEELYETSVRSVLYAKHILHSSSENETSAEDARNYIVDRIFCDLELFHWVFAELKPRLKHHRPSTCSPNKSFLSKNDLLNFGFLLPASTNNNIKICGNASEVEMNSVINHGNSPRSTKRNDNALLTKTQKAFNVWERIKESMEREIGTMSLSPFEKKSVSSPVFICWVTIRHNESGRFLTASANGKASLMPGLDLQGSVFGLYARPDTSMLAGILTRKEQMQGRKHQMLQRKKSIKGSGPLIRLSSSDHEKVGGVLVDAIEDDYDNDIPTSVFGESTVTVGFCQRSTAKWLGKKSIFGFGGGDIVCDSSIYGEAQEWEICDLRRYNTSIFNVNANCGNGGFVEVSNDDKDNGITIQVGKKCDNMAQRRASAWSIQELNDITKKRY